MHRHACTCIRVHAYTPAELARTHAHAHAQTNTHMHTHARAHTHAYKLACARIHANTHTHARMHAHRHACINAHKHASRTSPVLVLHVGQGDMLFHRQSSHKAHVWHNITGTALYLGPISRQRSTESISNFIFCQGALCTVPCTPSEPDAETPTAQGNLADIAVEI